MWGRGYTVYTVGWGQGQTECNMDSRTEMKVHSIIFNLMHENYSRIRQKIHKSRILKSANTSCRLRPAAR